MDLIINNNEAPNMRPIVISEAVYLTFIPSFQKRKFANPGNLRYNSHKGYYTGIL